MKNLAIVLGFFVLSGSARALVLLDNLTSATAFAPGSGVGFTGTSTFRKAVGIQVGSTAISLDSIEVMMGYSQNLSNNQLVSGGIFSDGVTSSNPFNVLASLTSASVATSTQTPSLTTLAPSAAFTLQANTRYWIVITGPTIATDMSWYAPNPNTAPTASNGVSYVGYRFDSGSGWAGSSTFNAVRINGTPVPEPAAVIGLGCGLVAMVRRRRNRV